MIKSLEMTAIGLMSGTSLDGIDAALIKGDGERITHLGPAHYVANQADQISRLQAVLANAVKEGKAFAKSAEYRVVERDYTLAHAQIVHQLLDQNNLKAADIDLLGFHGQTILHRPDQGWTWQMSDGDLLAQETGIAVVDDFRSADVAAGGQGAPFAPLYHAALLKKAGLQSSRYPICILNIGGVSNVTWIDGSDNIIGFDTGPGSAQLNDWITRHYGKPFDVDGAIAATGSVNDQIVRDAMNHPYFSAPYPKSLDRQDFNLDPVESLGPEDGAATLTAFTVAAIVHGLRQLPTYPSAVFVCGGGRNNIHLIKELQIISNVSIEPVEALGWRGDSLEAECFAHLAIRSVKGLPLSLPTTTGTREAVSGGAMHQAA